jgi:outer membrane lipoprotein-sorting protein
VFYWAIGPVGAGKAYEMRHFPTCSSACAIAVAVFFVALSVGGAIALAEGTTPTTSTEPVRGAATPEAWDLLQKVEAAHGDTTSLTLEAEFDQIRVWEEIGDEVRSSGELYLQMPDKLRCEYSGPDPSVVLFVDRTLYEYVPSINQVDTFTFETEEEARAQFRAVMLGFGVSGGEILESYNVERLAAPAGKEARTALVFKPVDPQMRKATRQITIWFDEKSFWPEKIRVEEVSGTTVAITVTKFLVGRPIKATQFEPKFSRLGHEAIVVPH